MIDNTERTARFTGTDGQTHRITAWGSEDKIRAAIADRYGIDGTTVTLTLIGDATPAPGWSRAGTQAGHSHGVCDNCGGRGRAHTRIDSSGITGRVCGQCSAADQAELTFA